MPGLNSCLALCISALLVVGCEYRRPADPVLGYEVYDEFCSDGLDNDGDGLIDCDDPECPFTSPWCGEQLGNVPPVERSEDNIYICLDGVDNDRNGQFDCGDRKCQGIQETCCLREFSDELCSDGLDNDGNGFADCADFGCTRGTYVTVCGPTEISGGLSPEDACSDGFDPDADGKVDCEDEDCVGVGSCPTRAEDSVERCTNLIDDDGDLRRDCEDPDCNSLPAICLPEGSEATVALCFDGLDNDGNGFTDCDDFACSRFGAQEVIERCMGGGLSEPEGDEITCFDGVDNDRNGFTDCLDFACSRNGPPEVVAACAARGENTFERCRDGIDNDGDGFTDCLDFSCRRPDADDVANDPALATACDETGGLDFVAAAELCRDGLDNDGDGFVDCDDWNCNWNPLTRAVCREQRGGNLICE